MEAAKNWWESDGGFFGDLYKEADDSFEGHLNSAKNLGSRTDEEVGGIIKLSDLNKGDSVLDCPSGYGRHSLGLAKAGMDVTGADINKKFLELSNRALAEADLPNCHFIEQDMRTLSFSNQFDVVINMFYSFGFFDTDEENFQVLKNFYEALKPGGRFLIHTHVTVPRLKSGALKNDQVRTLQSGRRLELTRRFNPVTHREDGTWYIVSPEGKRLQSLTPYSVRIYTDSEWEKLCREAGFQSVKIYGEWTGAAYSDESPQMIAVATK